MRCIEQIMGLPVSIDIPGAKGVDFKAIFERLRQIDERFSTYKSRSEVSKYIRGEVGEKDLSQELKAVIKACREAEEWTDGYFSAWAAGAFDPSGYVKGWAIAEAGKVIERQGFKTYCIGAGGDILARSRPTHHALSKPSKACLRLKRSWRHTQFFPPVLVQRTTRTPHSVPREEIASDAQVRDPRHGQNEYEKVWQIGIQDPHDPSKIVKQLNISNGAVATSGNYARGAHIINPKNKKPANELLSVTITGPDIIKADILATACFAMGQKAYSFMKKETGYEALIMPVSSQKTAWLSKSPKQT